ncbi:MAG TPA: glycoside hydrolase family 57 protein [Polyangia bacterium]|jgi:alpha-amylase/alpha-mannosidase (GH57 family)|nr:glycoside hydrolase family 57 protein [Polyangia bacterium]
MSRSANVVFLLHMHQPQYVDPRSGRALLPWVRLHGARGYLDVARLLDEYEGIRLTVNFVPSLVAQLQDVAAGQPGHEDEWLRIAELDGWNDVERAFAVERFFSLPWDRHVRRHPRYGELLSMREGKARFSDADVRDLTVLFNLGWLGFAAREHDAEVAALEQKQRGYTRQDLATVVQKQRAACARVLPLYRKLEERGQIEISSSPFYHPIVPLLVDTEHARRAMPQAKLPPEFAHPDDGALQIAKAKVAHEAAFGRQPRGMWPPEGSVSPEALALYADAKVGWLATDEGNLWRSLDGSGADVGRGALYQPWRFGDVDMVFRDREISDKIGFAYMHGAADAAVNDLLGRSRACAEQSQAPAGEPALVPIFLDGENPWESYAGYGEPFLRTLFGALSNDGQLRSASIEQHLQQAPTRRHLSRLHSGSWIDSDFHIWIADPVKNRAWELLGRARNRFARAVADGLAGAAREAAHERLLAAEGSDWFWWFGAPFTSMEDSLFDQLFRAHLAGAYQAMGLTVPHELEDPVAELGATPASVVSAPFAFIHPRIGGHGFYDWHGAGRYRVPRGAAMADSPLVATILFGFDRERLFVRLEPSDGRAAELATARLAIDIAVGQRRLRVTLGDDTADTSVRIDEEANGVFAERDRGGPAARGKTLELATPFARLGVAAGERLELAFQLFAAGNDAPLARYPADGSVTVIVPGEAFEAENWSA